MKAVINSLVYIQSMTDTQTNDLLAGLPVQGKPDSDRDAGQPAKRAYRRVTPAAAATFADEYSRGGNATDAARSARPDLVAQGASDKHLSVVGQRMLGDASVQRAITEYESVRAENAGLGLVHQRKVLTGEYVAGEDEKGRMARHAIEQEHGKATQKIESKHTVLKVKVDLTKRAEPEQREVIDVPAHASPKK